MFLDVLKKYFLYITALRDHGLIDNLMKQQNEVVDERLMDSVKRAKPALEVWQMELCY